MFQGKLVAQGTYDQLSQTHLASLTIMNAEKEKEADEVENQAEDDNATKEAEAVSQEMKAKIEVYIHEIKL